MSRAVFCAAFSALAEGAARSCKENASEPNGRRRGAAVFAGD